MSTIGALCARYLTDYPKTSGTKRNILERLQDEKIGKVEAPGTAKDFIDFARLRRETVAPATVLLDIIYLTGVLDYAKSGWGLADVTSAPIEEALPVLKKKGLIGWGRRRTRIPTIEEARSIVAYLRERDPLKAEVVEFQDYSSRRISETCRLQWGDLDGKTILVRDMKHPTHKIGNHKWVALPDEAFAIIQRQPRLTTNPQERIFKVSAAAVKSAFQRACKALGYPGLHLHDYRRGTTTRLLDAGYSVPMVMLVTGQVTAGMILTTYNALKASDFHKPRAA